MTQRMPISFSRLSTFEQCGLKFDYLYVRKLVQDTGSAATEFGTRVHSALEKAGLALTADAVSAEDAERMLDDMMALEQDVEVRKYLPLVAKIAFRPGRKFWEYQMAITQDRQVCGWFAQDVWLRGIADVLVVDGDTAWCVDWKAGKVRLSPTQLQIFALLIFLHFPEVKKVNTSYVWLVHDEVTNTVYERRFAESMWTALMPRFDALQDAVDLGVFRPKTGPLCNWCAAQGMCAYKKK